MEVKGREWGVKGREEKTGTGWMSVGRWESLQCSLYNYAINCIYVLMCKEAIQIIT